jgi:tetratricopeptide (TPR) repeat protein
MKPSSGRAPRAATLAVAILCGAAFAALPGSLVHAQASRQTTDGTPQIDASIASGNWNAALTQLDARIQSNPRDAQAKFKRGTVLAHLNRDNEAIVQFVELTQAYPELPEPYNNLAALYAKQGRYEEARTALETAIKANPSYGLAYENLGDLYLRLAAESYRRGVALGHASGATAQRLADLDKVISPPAAAKAKPVAAAPAEATPATPSFPVNTSPSFTFGGPTGALAQPPYVAPSH